MENIPLNPIIPVNIIMIIILIFPKIPLNLEIYIKYDIIIININRKTFFRFFKLSHNFPIH